SRATVTLPGNGTAKSIGEATGHATLCHPRGSTVSTGGGFEASPYGDSLPGQMRPKRFGGGDTALAPAASCLRGQKLVERREIGIATAPQLTAMTGEHASLQLQ